MNIILASLSLNELTGLLAAVLAFLVSLLTLYNAFKLRSGIIATSAYASGGGMLLLSLGFFGLVGPQWVDPDTMNILYHLLFIAGFALLGAGSFKIFQMSRIK